MDTKVRCAKCGQTHWQNEPHECEPEKPDSATKPAKKKRGGGSGWFSSFDSDEADSVGCALQAGCCLAELLPGCMVPLALALLLFHWLLIPAHRAAGQPPEAARIQRVSAVRLPVFDSRDFPDVFSAQFVATVRSAVSTAVKEHRGGSRAAEFYSAEGLRWSTPKDDSLLERFLRLPPDSPGCHRAETFLEEQGDPDGILSEREKVRFTELAAHSYFSAWRDAFRRSSPRSCYLGGQFSAPPPDSVLRGMRQTLLEPGIGRARVK